MKYVYFRGFWTDFDSHIFFLNHSYSFKHRIQLYLSKLDLCLFTFAEFICKVFSQRYH